MMIEIETPSALSNPLSPLTTLNPLNTPDEETIRDLALDPSHSFIIQAGAGSGKTSLLTLRILKLLTVVEKAPEECLAITFTRKAAAEMRDRIIILLHKVAEEEQPNSNYEVKLFSLAKAVLERDRKLGW